MMPTKKSKPLELPLAPAPSKPSETLAETLADRLEHALELRQMSQKGLEDEAKLSRGYVTRILKRERLKLSPDIMRRTADALGVSYEWLATGRGEVESATTSAALPERAEQIPALEAAIAYHRGKWSRPAIAAARALAAEPDADPLEPQDWADRLDQIEAALSKIKLAGRRRG